MMGSTIQKVMVVGAGQMGSGIAQVSAQAGYEVYLHDVSSVYVEKGLQTIDRSWSRFLQKGTLTNEQVSAAKARLLPSTDLANAQQVDLVIEAVTEQMGIKKDIFAKLDEVAPAHAIFASNTSSLSITDMAAITKRPEQFMGMHFMNPVPLMTLVEMIRGLQTSDAVYHTVEQYVVSVGKTPVSVSDYPGFVSNRVLMPMINEAIYCVYEGVATPEGVDQIMKLGMNHPMGPLTLADFIGLDTCLYIMEVLYEGFGDSKYRPCPLLRKYVEAGWLGKKTGRGFYQYNQ